MEVQLQCDIKLIQDAIAMGNNQVCDIIQKCRDIISDGGKVCFYEELLPPIKHRKDFVFHDLGTFNKWIKNIFPMLDC